ncbi:MAG TPA: methyltransferase domain-containing protein [Solirubrobacteraceae bacterium]|nr:methyltransferase domain-containing protein [Solirubrobacteraceae bacterium]
MREKLLALLRCPSCGSPSSLGLAKAVEDELEIREGQVRCRACELRRPVTGGIVDMLLDPSPVVLAEAEGLERFAQFMESDGWDRARVLRLPYEDNGYWFGQAQAMERLCETVPFTSGQRILDVGANTCWASAKFARADLYTVALDISMTEMQGLRTADWWFEETGTYFERVLGQMSELPFADGSFDWVFCCEVLHHNDRPGMAAALREIHRVLRPGGRLLVVNEPLRWPTDLKRDHAAQFEGNEHVYFLAEYLRNVWLAGFRRFEVLEPALEIAFSRRPIHLTDKASTLGSFKLAVKNIVRKHDLTRCAYKWWRYLMGPGISLQMICTKKF